jgi:electron transfer flavoprotein beta subunit
VSADLYLNEPRFIKLPQLMLAKKKPIELIKFEDLSIEYRKKTRIIKVIDGEIKKECKYLNSVDEIKDVLNIFSNEGIS